MKIRVFAPFAAFVILMGCVQAAEKNQLRPWDNYRVIMWIGDSAYKKPARLPLFFQRLREMGVNSAMVFGDGDPRPLVENQFPYYVENVVNRGLCLKFSSSVTDWDKFVTDWAASGRTGKGLTRDYSLDDPEWRKWATDQMQRLARKNAPHQPFAYDIRDELSTTISANPFDYDFSPKTLAGFRAWLKTGYQSLPALNEQWETKFTSWDEVMPFTTDQIKNRMASGEALPRGKPDWQAVQKLRFDPRNARQSPTRWNFSPWADFRTYMDRSLAGALDGIRQAAREVDPHTPVGIEGTQMPSAFGGYDLWRMSQVLDWVEPYDIGNAREIFGSFMPGKPIITTVGEKDANQARRRLWHLLLEGDRGCIVWWSEDCIDWNSEDYALTPRAKALAPVLREMTSPIARILLRAEQEYDPIYIHYSQPSIQVDWLLESTVDGSTWLRRFSSYEASHNRMARVRNAWLKLFQDMGFSPQFISGEQLEQIEEKLPLRSAVVLPQSLALTDKELNTFARIGSRTTGNSPGISTLFCDGTPGMFDGHGRLRSSNPLESLFPAALSTESNYVARAQSGAKAFGTLARGGGITEYAKARLQASTAAPWQNWARDYLPIDPPVSVPDGSCVRVHRFKLGKARLFAFERNINYQMSEDLRQAGGNEALEKPLEFTATFKTPAHLYDVNTGRYFGKASQARFTLDPWHPAILAAFDEELPSAGVMAALEQLK